MTALDSTTGETLWTTALPKKNGEPQYSRTGYFAVGAGGVYVETNLGEIVALSSATGNICWKRTIDGGSTLIAPAIADSTVFVAEMGSVRALDYLTGEQKWKRDDVSSGSSLGISVDGAVIYGTDDGSLRAVGGRSGDIKWTLETGDFGKTFPSIAEGVIYAPSEDGMLYAVDGSTGRILWTEEVGDPSALQRPVLVGGYLYLVADNEVRAYGIA